MDSLNKALPRVEIDNHSPSSEAFQDFQWQLHQLQICPKGAAEAVPAGPGVTESQLDKMSLVWLAKQNESLGRDITKADLSASQASEFDSLMASHVLNQYEAIRHAHYDPDHGFLHLQEKEALTKADIDASLQKVEQQRQSMDYADPLVRDNGALFNMIAKDHDGVQSINYWDLKEVRQLDDYRHSIGSTLLTDDQRAVVDDMYHRWSKGEVRTIEDVPSNAAMGCDGAITMQSLAKGTGFTSAEELKAQFNRTVDSIDSATNCAQTRIRNNRQVLRHAKADYQSSLRDIEAFSHHIVQQGEGFDKIAQQNLSSKNNPAPSEQDIVAESQKIAKMNGFDRNTYDPKKNPLQPGQDIVVHDEQWKREQREYTQELERQYIQNNLDQ
jgi:hypothetical protein